MSIRVIIQLSTKMKTKLVHTTFFF